jgi:hypothetical protein
MARIAFIARLRQRRRSVATGLIYALLLNVLLAGIFQAQALAASLDPLAAAANCDGTTTDREPARHNSQHQPDCTLCSQACPMAAAMPALVGGTGLLIAPAAFARDVSAQAAASVIAPSTYCSDISQQAPPALA